MRPATTRYGTPSRLPGDAPETGRRRTMMMVGAGGAMLLVAMAFLATAIGIRSSLVSRPAPSSTEEEVTTAPSVMGSIRRRQGDPDALLVRAWKRARGWDKAALLVAIDVPRVVAGKVDFNADGAVVFTFGQGAGGSIAPGSKVGARRLTLTYGPEGETVTEGAGPAGKASAVIPTCPFSTAIRVAGAKAKDAKVRYHALGDRNVWEVSVGTERPVLVDGHRCTVLLNR